MKNFLIYGYSLSGESALNLLIKKVRYNKVFIYDDNEQVQKKALNSLKSVPNVYVINNLIE